MSSVLTPPAAAESGAAMQPKGGHSASAPDTATLSALAAFLRDYDHALAADDRGYLSAHTIFPMSFSDTEYDMEAKKHAMKVASVDELLKIKDRLRWPQEMIPASPEALAGLHRGAQKCNDPKSPDVPDWTQGPPALQVHGDEAKLSYIGLPCDSETHLVTVTLKRVGGTWKLHDRTIHLGPV